ncbi:crotonase/enoyl-CoA hydratase family protein [Rhizobium sp. KVB221]|uniref:Crotonase/enoyl-CoA hydratase family protein n=1 Tax=Rhizobium setariae TaxID=2801340 RepID=A0A937CN59_9HYPH|nr:crotonase/enoyl-CoA hydratase family protein [Rhizobium setariae]MBL0370793.1 crotonase/enoyl-CoA hydratase family protein [Rhizobium setariae]
MTDLILLELPADHPGVLVIRMNRADKKNAITREMYGAMALALADADANEAIKAAVLFGAPGCFSSGNDLMDFMEIAKVREEGKNVIAFVRELARFTKPLLSGVDGIAIGIGVTMNFHCDLTFATPRTVFRTPFTDLAVVPEAGSTLLGPAIMGHQRAFAMLVNGLPFSAEEAREAGIVWKVVSEEELEATTLAAASNLVARPHNSLMLSRKLLKGDRDVIRSRIDEEMEHFLDQLQSSEAAGVYEAFFARKK